jgi:4'-phosphopantetheinyl transferase
VAFDYYQDTKTLPLKKRLGPAIKSFRLSSSDTLVRIESTADLLAFPAADLQMWLSDDERKRAEGFGSIKRRNEYTASRVLAKQCLAEFTLSEPAAWHIGRSETGAAKAWRGGHGDQNISVSISHSEFYCAVAIANRPIGLDLQFIEPLERWRAIENKVFSDIELAAIKNYPTNFQSKAYCEIWALKEAHGKYHEHGLQIRGSRNISFIALEDAAQNLQALSMNLGSYILAIYADKLSALKGQQGALSSGLKAWQVQT